MKKIIFTGGISKSRDKKNFYHLSPSTYNNNKIVNNLNWEDLSEADWGTELFFENIYNKDYQKHITQLTKNFLKTSGINPEDILIESMSSTTQENAEFCKNIFNIEAAESGLEINSAILVTTCTHGNRAIEQFKKVFGNRIKLDWCPSTIDLEKYESLKSILKNPNFDEIAFRKELKQVYCSTPELIQSLREEIGHHRNVFIRGEINEPIIETVDTQAISKNNFIR